MPDSAKDVTLGIGSQCGGHLLRRVDGHREEMTCLDICCGTHGALPQLLPRLLCHHPLAAAFPQQGLSRGCAEKIVGLLDRGGGLGEGRTGLGEGPATYLGVQVAELVSLCWPWSSVARDEVELDTLGLCWW